MKQAAAPELKRKLRESGFDIYRTRPDRVILAERIRNNLIMDSGIAAITREEYSIEVVIRAQQSHFPGEAEEAIREHTTDLAAPFLDDGYEETEQSEEAMMDPSEPTHQLDILYELKLSKNIGDFQQLIDQLRLALTWQRATNDEIPSLTD